MGVDLHAPSTSLVSAVLSARVPRGHLFAVTWRPRGLSLAMLSWILSDPVKISSAIGFRSYLLVDCIVFVNLYHVLDFFSFSYYDIIGATNQSIIFYLKKFRCIIGSSVDQFSWRHRGTGPGGAYVAMKLRWLGNQEQWRVHVKSKWVAQWGALSCLQGLTASPASKTNDLASAKKKRPMI